MAYVVTKIKNGRYLYHQTSKRVGKKVKTTSTYIGPVNAKGIVSLFGSRAQIFLAKPDDELFQKEAATEDHQVITGLTDGEAQTAEQSFLHESGLSPSSSDGGGQSFGSEGQSEA
jgi:hypothetical protein